MKFRKRPVVVEAFQWNKSGRKREWRQKVPAWADANVTLHESRRSQGQGHRTVTVEPSRPGSWMLVCVVCRDATNEAEAKQLCKESVAYKGILRKYPSTEWEREYIRTHNTPPSAGSGMWTVEFRVRRK